MCLLGCSPKVGNPVRIGRVRGEGNAEPGGAVFSLVFPIGGVFGFLLKKFQFEPAPLVLALVLGPMLEDNLRQSLIISQGNFSIFISRPLSVAFLAVSASALLFPLLRLRPRLRETTE